jgi:YVTN family beta-propeller protein
MHDDAPTGNRKEEHSTMQRIMRRSTLLLVLTMAALAWATPAAVSAVTVSTITVGSQPIGIAVNPLTNTVYVANNGSNSVSVITAGTNAVTTITDARLNGPGGVAVKAVGNTSAIYVSNGGSGTIAVLSGATNTVTGTISVGGTPGQLAYDPANDTLYVVQFAADTVQAINATTNAITTLTGFTGPAGVAVNPVTNLIYVTNFLHQGGFGQGFVSVINGATNTVSPTTIPVGVGPQSLAVDSSTNTIYVGNTNDPPAGGSSNYGSVSVINGAAGSVTTTVRGSAISEPEGLAVDPTTKMLYVANVAAAGQLNVLGTNTVTPINTATNTLGTPIPVGREPLGVAFNAAANAVYTTNYQDGTVSVIPTVSLLASPTNVPVGGTVIAAWNNFTPTGHDWVSLHAAGAPDSAVLAVQSTLSAKLV